MATLDNELLYNLLFIIVNINQLPIADKVVVVEKDTTQQQDNKAEDYAQFHIFRHTFIPAKTEFKPIYKIKDENILNALTSALELKAPNVTAGKKTQSFASTLNITISIMLTLIHQILGFATYIKNTDPQQHQQLMMLKF
eukprot:UN07415